MSESSYQADDAVEWRESNGVWHIKNWPYISRIAPMVRLEAKGWAWVLNGFEEQTYASTLEEAQHDSLVAALAKLNPLIKGVQACAERTALTRADLINARRCAEMNVKWTHHITSKGDKRHIQMEAQVAGRTVQVGILEHQPGDQHVSALYNLNSMPNEAAPFNQVIVYLSETGGDHQAAWNLAVERAKNRGICEALDQPAFEWHVTLEASERWPSVKEKTEGNVIATDPGRAISTLALRAGCMPHHAAYVPGEAKALSGPEVGAVYKRATAFGHSQAVLIQPASSEAITQKEET